MDTTRRRHERALVLAADISKLRLEIERLQEQVQAKLKEHLALMDGGADKSVSGAQIASPAGAGKGTPKAATNSDSAGKPGRRPSPSRRLILEALEKAPATAEDLAQRLGLETSKVYATLHDMKRSGALVSGPVKKVWSIDANGRAELAKLRREGGSGST